MTSVCKQIVAWQSTLSSYVGPSVFHRVTFLARAVFVHMPSVHVAPHDQMLTHR